MGDSPLIQPPAKLIHGQPALLSTPVVATQRFAAPHAAVSANQVIHASRVRGFLSGAIGKKMGLTVVSSKGEDGDRTYSIEA